MVQMDELDYAPANPSIRLSIVTEPFFISGQEREEAHCEILMLTFQHLPAFALEESRFAARFCLEV